MNDEDAVKTVSQKNGKVHAKVKGFGMRTVCAPSKKRKKGWKKGVGHITCRRCRRSMGLPDVLEKIGVEMRCEPTGGGVGVY